MMLRLNRLWQCRVSTSSLTGAAFALALSCVAPSSAHPQTTGGEIRDETNPFNLENIGFPVSEYFNTRRLGGGYQIWRIAQDSRGIIYAASNQSLLQYDGESWRPIQMPESRWVTSVAVDRDDKVYVGASGFLGVLEPDSVGRLRATSLMGFVDTALTDFDRVSEVLVADDGVYFSTRKTLFRFDREGGFDTWRSETGFFGARIVDDAAYVFEVGAGLQLVGNDGLTTIVPASEVPQGLAGVYEHDGGLLLMARGRGLLRLENGTLTTIPSAADRILRNERVDWSYEVIDGLFAFVMLDTERLLFFDSSGSFQHGIDETTGLGGSSPLTTLVDRAGDMWIGSNHGMARSPLHPITVFDERAGLHGMQIMVQHDGAIYASDAEHLFRIQPTSRFVGDPMTPHDQRVALERVEGIDGWVFGLEDVGGDLLVGSGGGVYRYRNRRLRRDVDGVSIFKMAWDHRRPNWLIMATSIGHVGQARREADGRWRHIGLLTHLQSGPVEILPAGDTIWISTESNGVFRLLLAGDSLGSVERFAVDEGLPSAVWTSLIEFDGVILFGTSSGIYRFDDESSRFAPDTSVLSRAIPYDTTIHTITDLSDGYVFVGGAFGAGLMRRLPDGGYDWVPSALGSLTQPASAVIEEENSSVLWIDSDYLYRYDRSMDQLLSNPSGPSGSFATLIRRISDFSGNEIFGGDISPLGTNNDVIRLPYETNELRFEYSASSFGPEGFKEFQQMLEGFDDDWSTWTEDNRITYTNLPPRAYEFKVRSRDTKGRVGTEATFRFVIKPPWYRTLIAYFSYALLVVLTVGGFVRWRSYALERSNAMLEKMVSERTLALESANRALTDSLAEINTLKGIIPICAACKKVRDDKGYWEQVEVYVTEHSDAQFSHGLCPNCVEEHYADMGLTAEEGSRLSKDDSSSSTA